MSHANLTTCNANNSSLQTQYSSWLCTPELNYFLRTIHDSSIPNYSNNLTHACSNRSYSEGIIMDEAYIDTLIDLELRNVQSSLGLVWSKLSNTSNDFTFETCNSENLTTTNDMITNNSTCNKHSNKNNSNTKKEKQEKKHQPLSNNSKLTNNMSFHQPESITLFDNNKKISKQRTPNYRVRFSHNKFEEIIFKKSNPKAKYIIFK